MKTALFWFSSFGLQILAVTLFLLGIFAILYPLIIVGGSLIIVLGLIFLIAYPYKTSKPDRIIDNTVIRKKRNRWIGLVKEYSVTRRFLRSIWISIIAMVFSFSLMGVLKIHSWLFYINPLSKELEPYRKVFYEKKQDFTPLKPSLETGA